MEFIFGEFVERTRPVVVRYSGGVVVIFRQVPEVHPLDAKCYGKPSERFEMQTILIVEPTQEKEIGGRSSAAARIRLMLVTIWRTSTRRLMRRSNSRSEVSMLTAIV
jgi:hypothetical protein